MDAIVAFFNGLSSLGVSVVMPIVLTIIGCCFGAGFGKSLKAGLTVGIGFIGLNLVINQLMGTDLASAVTAMVNRFGLELSVIDVGWPAASAIAMGSVVGTIIIPLALLVNVVMLLTNTTQTADVDIWNYWHFAFTGALVAIVTNNVGLGIFAAIINEVVVLIIGDVTAPLVEESLGLPGVSIPHGFSGAYVPIAFAVNWLLDKIPGIKNINWDVRSMQKKFGVFGDPVMLGSIIGLVIGILAGYGLLPVTNSDGTTTQSVLYIAVAMGAVMVLIPRMAALLMEGLLPISDAASAFIQKHFSNRGKIYIGLDSAVGTGHPVTLTMALILVPVAVFLAFILPGNKVVPLADLACIPYMLVLITPIVHENGFRGLLVGIVVLAVGFYIATDLSPLITSAAANVNFDMGGAAAISSICDGANPLTWLIVRFGTIGTYIGLVVLAVGDVALALWNRKRILREAAELHEESAEAAAQK
ncbi:PTS galactitol transporter subunit IIC [Olsenella porci]|jgi:PTS system galactitol-specific IIC component|uniref:PTS sugar transporter subunit IIC n=1 Tax=Olsenella porci TaxID=2652279 RepID=A0A6N7XP24_9ACTN|nr:PTS transporter subunit IIC [Olsenella porci]MCI1997231.1 PTS sugar transporter subunit IIC [Olsenella sp.]MST71736.1 PTS sugar transporter subunit IIC [Olsenella porci]